MSAIESGGAAPPVHVPATLDDVLAEIRALRRQLGRLTCDVPMVVLSVEEARAMEEIPPPTAKSHQDILLAVEAARVECMAAWDAATKAQRAKLSTIREECGAIGHIFGPAQGFMVIMPNLPECAICGARERQCRPAP